MVERASRESSNRIPEILAEKQYSPNAAKGGTAARTEGPGDGRAAQRVGGEDADYQRDSEDFFPLCGRKLQA